MAIFVQKRKRWADGGGGPVDPFTILDSEPLFIGYCHVPCT